MKLKYTFYSPSEELAELLKTRLVQSRLTRKWTISRDTLWRIATWKKKVVSASTVIKMIEMIKTELEEFWTKKTTDNELLEKYFYIYNYITKQPICPKKKTTSE